MAKISARSIFNVFCAFRGVVGSVDRILVVASLHLRASDDYFMHCHVLPRQRAREEFQEAQADDGDR